MKMDVTGNIKMKYNLSIGAIFKNEYSGFKEWLEHYLNRGVEHFYLINDNSEDDYIEIINEYKSYITLFNTDESYEKNDRQDFFYKKFFLPIKDETKWLLICDLDEYVWSPLNINMNDTLSLMEKENIASQLINMVLFGSNNFIKQPKCIVDSFTKRQNMDEVYCNFVKRHNQYKTIALTSYIKEIKIHRMVSIYDYMFHTQKQVHDNIQNISIDISNKKLYFYNKPNLTDLNSNFFRLNHYRLQSEERWINTVMKRGDASRFNPINLRNFSSNIDQKNNSTNFRTLEIFHKANEIQNDIEDLDLINQNMLIT